MDLGHIRICQTTSLGVVLCNRWNRRVDWARNAPPAQTAERDAEARHYLALRQRCPAGVSDSRKQRFVQ